MKLVLYEKPITDLLNNKHKGRLEIISIHLNNMNFPSHGTEFKVCITVLQKLQSGSSSSSNSTSVNLKSGDGTLSGQNSALA